ncbi:hypothetical protein GCM10017562_16040 [Streptomyces roseofulvus]|uniref:SMI1/KNR4 family protein n=1 Tax=Streptomyces roseofulvus TaxID=33902 RepID=UPI0031F87DEF
MTERERAVGEIVAVFAEAAPVGWRRAAFHWQESDGGISMGGGYETADGGQQRLPLRTVHRRLVEPARVLRESCGTSGSTAELECAADGTYRLVVAPTAGTRPGLGGGGIILDPAARLPEPGLAEETGTAAPAGDPEEAVALFRAILARRAALLGGPERLPAPARESAIETAERRLGARLPADLRALYALADGDLVDGRHRDVLGEAGWLSLDGMVAAHAHQAVPDWMGWSLGWDAVILDAEPPRRVRRCTGDPTRIPFLTNEDGNYRAVDLAPARHGHPGQVIVVGRDHAHGATYLTESVTALLRWALGELERGAYEVADGNVWLDRALSSAQRLRPRPGTVAEPPGPEVQEVEARGADGPVDLGALAGAPALRRVTLYGGASARDLTPLRTAPVESLTTALTGTAGGLAPLAGHPRLRALRLTGAAAPVDLAPLRTVPGLCGLALSGVPLADPSVLAELPGLLYLVLDRRQWAALLDAGGAPTGLAAAGLGEPDAGLDETLDLAARLGHPLDAFRAEGTLPAPPVPASARNRQTAATPRSPGAPGPTP